MHRDVEAKQRDDGSAVIQTPWRRSALPAGPRNPRRPRRLCSNSRNALGSASTRSETRATEIAGRRARSRGAGRLSTMNTDHAVSGLIKAADPDAALTECGETLAVVRKKVLLR